MEGKALPTYSLTFGQFVVLKADLQGDGQDFLDNLVEEIKILLDQNVELFTAL